MYDVGKVPDTGVLQSAVLLSCYPAPTRLPCSPAKLPGTAGDLISIQLDKGLFQRIACTCEMIKHSR